MDHHPAPHYVQQTVSAMCIAVEPGDYPDRIVTNQSGEPRILSSAAIRVADRLMVDPKGHRLCRTDGGTYFIERPPCEKKDGGEGDCGCGCHGGWQYDLIEPRNAALWALDRGCRLPSLAHFLDDLNVE